MTKKPLDEYITIGEAAKIGGFCDASSLHRAARKGTLQTTKFGERMYLTTRQWLTNYLGTVKPRANPRGQPKNNSTTEFKKECSF